MLDLTTGRGGVVSTATRWTVTNEELYGVLLDDARIVTRFRNELELQAGRG